MQFIDVTPVNIENEHICCAITEKKGENCVANKKAWMLAQFENGLVFKKADVRGKVFIEYIPAEYAFAPIDAPGYMFINCLWVSGQYKGKGYSTQLLNAAIADAKSKGKKGLCIISSAKKKMAFLSDPKFLTYKGFVPCDEAAPYFVLYYLPLAEDAKPPAFLPSCKTGTIDEVGLVIYYAHQCPFTEKYVDVLEETLQKHGLKLKRILIDSVAAAKAAPSAVTNYALFKDGAFLTNEILSAPKAEKLLIQK